MEQGRLADLTRSIELEPNNAWPYYERARYWYSLGEGDNGLADLMAGNAATVNRLPKPFPISFVYESMANGEVPGNKVLAGAILESDMAFHANWLEWKDVMQEISISAALGGDAEQLTVFHDFCCRLARADYATIWEFQAAGALLLGQLDYVQTELASGLRPSELRSFKAQQIAAGALLNRLNILQERLRPLMWDYYMLPETFRVTGYSNPAGTSGTLTQLEWERTQSNAATKSFFALIIPRYRLSDYLVIVKAEQRFQQSDVDEVIDELHGFDYSTPEERIYWLY
jgi:hypothetical protein